MVTLSVSKSWSSYEATVTGFPNGGCVDPSCIDAFGGEVRCTVDDPNVDGQAANITSNAIDPALVTPGPTTDDPFIQIDFSGGGLGTGAKVSIGGMVLLVLMACCCCFALAFMAMTGTSIELC